MPTRGRTAEDSAAAARPQGDRYRWMPVVVYVTATAVLAVGAAWLAGAALADWDRRLALAARLVLALGIPVTAGLLWRPWGERRFGWSGGRR